MNCKKCGQLLPSGAGVCVFCGTEAENYDEVMKENIERFGMQKCEHCGYIGEAVPEKMLRKIDWVILILTFSTGIGVLYFVYLYFKRGDPTRRNLVCPSCKKVMKLYIDDRTMEALLSDTESTAKIKNGIKTVVRNPELKKGARELRKSLRDLQDSFRP